MAWAILRRKWGIICRIRLVGQGRQILILKIGSSNLPCGTYYVKNINARPQLIVHKVDKLTSVGTHNVRPSGVRHFFKHSTEGRWVAVSLRSKLWNVAQGLRAPSVKFVEVRITALTMFYARVVEWRHACLKSRFPKGSAGSSPALGTLISEVITDIRLESVQQG